MRRGPRSVRRRSFDVGRLARGRRRGGILARVWTSGPPDSGMEIPDRKAGTEEIRVSEFALERLFGLEAQRRLEWVFDRSR